MIPVGPNKKTFPDLVGIFVGGRSLRMGRPKGLLPSPLFPEKTLLSALIAMCRDELGVQVVLVGERAEYAAFDEVTLADAASSVGPLGGVIALLEEAERRGLKSAVVCACDMPYLSSALLCRLLAEYPGALAVCPKSGDFYEPLFARYSIAALGALRSSLFSGNYSLQGCLRALSAAELVLSTEERQQLVDWDTPSDIKA